VRADRAEPGEGDRGSGAAHRLGGEPERVAAPTTPLKPRKAEPFALLLTFPGLNESGQRPVQIPESLLVDALGVLFPPAQGRVRLLLSVP